jgi:hypothetical protein
MVESVDNRQWQYAKVSYYQFPVTRKEKAVPGYKLQGKTGVLYFL